MPGRWWWLARAASWVAVVLWRLAGVWIGAAHAEPSMSRIAWTLGWWLVAAAVAWHLLRARWAVLVAAAAVLAWPAYTSPGSSWSWVVYGWLAGAVVLPQVRARVTRPLWSRRRVWEGNVFGEPSWHGVATAPVALELTVIPGVRVTHRVGPAEHAIVLDRRIALIGGPDTAGLAGYRAKVWPSAVATDPQRAVDEIEAWLLSDTDGWTVDRRTLAAVTE